MYGQDEYVVGNPALAGTSYMVVLSGCSGGGKAALLTEMARRGFEAIPEPGRQIVKEQLAVSGDGLPWQNVMRFAELCISRGMYLYNTVRGTEKGAIFDRSLVDNITGLQRAGIDIPHYMNEALRVYRYARKVFLVPPWKELFANDAERRHSFEEAEKEYEGLKSSYQGLGYETEIVPKMTVEERANYLQRAIGKAG